jgi:hypothetical protein
VSKFFNFSLDLYTIGRTPWTSDRPVTRPLPKYRATQTQENARTHTHTPNIHAVSGIRTHDHSVRASEDSLCLRPLSYRDRPTFLHEGKIKFGLLNLHSIHVCLFMCPTLLLKHLTDFHGTWYEGYVITIVADA